MSKRRKRKARESYSALPQLPAGSVWPPTSFNQLIITTPSPRTNRCCAWRTAPQTSPPRSTPEAATCAAGGNPQTGPFYIEVAEPGDTLMVRLDLLYPNRDHGYTATVVAPNVVDPWYVRHLPEGGRADWRIDREQGTATLVSPETKLGNLTLPLSPMLGCFGVAPGRGQAISTATSAEHGGNMDYRGFRQGVT